jgi:hypothetical protein
LFSQTSGRSGNPGGFSAVAKFADNPMQIDMAKANPKTDTEDFDNIFKNIITSNFFLSLKG